MSLDINWTGVKDSHELFEKDEDGNDQFKPLSHTIFMMCMNIGVDWGIREENVDEVIARFWTYQKVFGPLLCRFDENGKKEGVYITPDDIRRHIGLKLNVAHIKDRTWYANLVRGLKADVNQEIKRYDERKE